MTDITKYTDEEVVRCIELCEELLEQLRTRVNTARKRLMSLHREKTRRELEAAVAAGKENA